ncbi:MAG: metallophosphoesterase family protein [Promethearchaeota archaeon]
MKTPNSNTIYDTCTKHHAPRGRVDISSYNKSVEVTMEPVKFMHIADTHLGYRQYRSEYRFRDFNRVFNWTLNRAIEEEVDFIIHCGDFFHENNVGPDTLTAVFNIMKKFREKSLNQLGRAIPFICIEGNHDRRGHGQLRSWMEFLADLNLVILLSVPEDEIKNNKQVKFRPYSEKYHRGGVYKVKNVEIYGVQYFGSSTPAILGMIHAALPEHSEQAFRLLMMHVGVQGQVKDMYGIDRDKTLQDLREKVDYLGLGHFHKQFILDKNDPWIFNPGSLEITAVKEIFEGYERGAFIMEIYGKEQNKWSISTLTSTFGTATEPNEIPNRRIFRMSKAVDIGGEGLSTFELATKHVISRLEKYQLKTRDGNAPTNFRDLNVPVAFVSINGKVPYSKFEVNTRELSEQIKEHFQVLEVRVSNWVESSLDGIKVDEATTKNIGMIEREVLLALVGENEVYAPKKEEVVALMGDVKRILTGDRQDGANVKDMITTWWLNKTGEKPNSLPETSGETVQPDATLPKKPTNGNKKKEMDGISQLIKNMEAGIRDSADGTGGSKSIQKKED